MWIAAAIGVGTDGNLAATAFFARKPGPVRTINPAMKHTAVSVRIARISGNSA